MIIDQNTDDVPLPQPSSSELNRLTICNCHFTFESEITLTFELMAWKKMRHTVCAFAFITPLVSLKIPNILF